MIAETRTLLNPVQIGDMTIDPPLSLAPMAGQTNHAFRRLCREIGGVGLVCTELLSSVPLQFKGGLKTSLQYFDWRPEERPFAVQLFGSDPSVMAEASRIVVDHGAAIVDINMGCWVPKVVKKGGGAALLRDVCSATAVVEACVKAVDVPVTVKVRAGFDDGVITAVPFAKAAQDVGAQMIAVHARFASQGFTGSADWDVIRQVKEAVTTLPVFGNGDVTCADDARRMLEQTGCDGVMIGRAALGNPWIFKQIHHELTTGTPFPAPTVQERAQTCLYQARLTLETTRMAPVKAIRELRGQLCKYTAGMPDATTIRDGIVRAESLEDIERALAPVLSDE
ncbi:MAG: tRNA dihydrouridine synthase DusB [Anaerolineae bacterium]|nr:tRNA dihydrouridine synthase DusB [Chloroflexota bacterium]MBV6436507.1 putative tRNA-dihydrouridine synthase [Anaerolineae bacterium]MCO6442798.1 tRNA dihydrouridine synthase DusB [Anaerolineae bacterium]MDL1917174.1 tRNA dihydrouridine synthase DusB [Anaerolineae bacterium CFX4]RIK18778.1 MAG: tRNA dihydrouridine synthase DusB [Chloroflexota bacterium]